MSIRHLRTLVAIAEKGSFAAAADAVFVTQAAVSMQMKSLEDELGMPLFDRSKRPPVLNEAGRALIPKARDVLRAYDRLDQIGQDDDEIEGHLIIGAVPSTITGVMPRALLALRAKHPRLHVELTTGPSADLAMQVSRGNLDAAVISDLRHPIEGLAWEPFAWEPLIVIAPMDAPEMAPEQLLETYPFIRFSRRAWVGRLIDELLKDKGIRVSERMTLDSLEAIATMVFHGLGVSIVPYRTVGTPFPVPLQRIPFGKPPTNRVLGLIQRDGNAKAELTEALLKELTALSDEIGPDSRAQTHRTKPRRAKSRSAAARRTKTRRA